MKFRLLIEADTHTTIRELHVERVTGRLNDVTREYVQVLDLEPVMDELLPRSTEPATHPPTSANWKEQRTAGGPGPRDQSVALSFLSCFLRATFPFGVVMYLAQY